MEKKNNKWTVLLLVSFAYFMAQGTRAIYSAVLPQIKVSFGAGVTDAQLGLVGSTFALVFGIVIPLAGLSAVFFSRKWVLVTGLLLFSSGIFLSGFATGIGMLLVTYGFLNAAGQSLMPPCNSSLIGQYHIETRGTAFSIYQIAIYLGIVSCMLLSSRMAAGNLGADGWRYAFWILGGVAIIWAVVMAVSLKDTPLPGNQDGKPSVREALRAFFSKPTALIMMLALGCYFFTNYGVILWCPTFMTRVFPDMAQTTATFHAVLWFYAGSLAGATLAGRISDRLKQRRPAARFEVELAGLLLCIPSILIMVFAHSLPMVIVGILLFGFASGVYDSNLYAAMLDVITPRYHAFAIGIFGCGGCIVGALGPVVIGWLSDLFGIQLAFSSMAVFALLGAVFISAARLWTVRRDLV